MADRVRLRYRIDGSCMERRQPAQLHAERGASPS